MNFLPNGMSLALYAVVAVCAVALATVWLVTNRARRNAGFADKGQLKRQMSAAAVLKATEIRPSLTRGEESPSHTAAVSLAEKCSATS
ncbi:hypothetical protein [Streptomyces sp. CBMA123]|uniref:hypothetical protein n=1 Tax=Streptomyces sp. CBMA123 TaxID=1896313 RepID=UPI0016619885|nr:hypothetical protein [Streptomyces sp. CBMA123]